MVNMKNGKLKRVSELIDGLGLQPHREGGYYRELFRSGRFVKPDDARSRRAAVTTIFYLLASGQYSRWHRVVSDEVWHYYEGEPLELFWIEPDGERLHKDLLGPLASGGLPVRVVPAGCWQAARPAGTYVLAGCTVGPGFDFDDFELLAALPGAAEMLRRRFPEAAALV
jgi:uncharacterized protein